MQKLFGRAALLASVAALAAAPAAMASGGKLFGGGATGGGGGGSTTTTTASGGGGGGGGGGGSVNSGGVNGGGANDPTTTVPAAPAAPTTPGCATLANVTAPVGYYLTYAALWNDFTVRSCSSSQRTVNVRVTDTNRLTGSVDYDVTVPYSVGAQSNVNGILDNDFAPFNTDYDVKIEARDESGNLLDSSSTVATTPPPK